MLRCVSVSSGIAHGTAYVLSSVDQTMRTMVARRSLKAADVVAEVARFDTALSAAEKGLLALREDVARRIGASEADIFTAQALVVRDKGLRTKVVTVIQQRPGQRRGRGRRRHREIHPRLRPGARRLPSRTRGGHSRCRPAHPHRLGHGRRHESARHSRGVDLGRRRVASVRDRALRAQSSEGAESPSAEASFRTRRFSRVRCAYRR
jgi:hypothetical protein